MLICTCIECPRTIWGHTSPLHGKNKKINLLGTLLATNEKHGAIQPQMHLASFQGPNMSSLTSIEVLEALFWLLLTNIKMTPSGWVSWPMDPPKSSSWILVLNFRECPNCLIILRCLSHVSNCAILSEFFCLLE